MNQFSFLFSPIGQALGATLLYSLWQAFIIFFLIRLMLRFVSNTTAAFRYIIFSLSYLGIAIWSVITFVQQLTTRQSELMFTKMAGSYSSLHAENLDASLRNFGGFSLSFFDHLFPWLTALYLAGVVCFSGRFLYSYFLTIRLRTEGLTEMDPVFMDRLWLLAAKMKVRKPVYAYLSKYVVTPVVMGFFKPMILLPIASVNNLSPSQMEAVLLHELAHVSRNDYLFNLLQTVIDIFLFFNPFAYWISKKIRTEREICCDEMVLQSTDPYLYARALLTLEEAGQNHHLLAMGANNNSTQLLNRIKNIMEMKNKNILLKQKLIALAIVIVGIISAAWLIPQTNKKPEKNDGKVAMNESLTTLAKSNTLLTEQTPEAGEWADTNHPKVVSPPSPPSAPKPPVASNLPAPPAAPLAPIFPPAGPNLPAPPAPPAPPLPRNGFEKGMKDTIPFTSDYFKSPEYQKQMDAIQKSTEAIKKYFESDSWKNQQKAMEKNAAALDNYFKSPDWKHQLETIEKSTATIGQYFNSDEWKKQQQEIKKNVEKSKAYFNSDEWKQQQNEILKNAQKAQEYFNSDEWKKYQKEFQKNGEKMQEYFNSDEWKKHQKEFQKNAEKMQEYFKSDQWKKQWENMMRSVDSLSTGINRTT